jgi:hypothetical protein
MSSVNNDSDPKVFASTISANSNSNSYSNDDNTNNELAMKMTMVNTMVMSTSSTATPSSFGNTDHRHNHNQNRNQLYPVEEMLQLQQDSTKEENSDDGDDGDDYAGEGDDEDGDEALDETDSSNVEEAEFTKQLGVARQFPLRLHAILEDAEAKGYSNIVSWIEPCDCTDHANTPVASLNSPLMSEVIAAAKTTSALTAGNTATTRFRVHNSSKFVQHFTSIRFNQSKYKSFTRQLNMWGFERVQSGKDRGAYQHIFFQKGRPELCQLMNRQSSCHQKKVATKRKKNQTTTNTTKKTKRENKTTRSKTRKEKPQQQQGLLIAPHPTTDNVTSQSRMIMISPPTLPMPVELPHPPSMMPRLSYAYQDFHGSADIASQLLHNNSMMATRSLLSRDSTWFQPSIGATSTSTTTATAARAFDYQLGQGSTARRNDVQCNYTSQDSIFNNNINNNINNNNNNNNISNINSYENSLQNSVTSLQAIGGAPVSSSPSITLADDLEPRPIELLVSHPLTISWFVSSTTSSPPLHSSSSSSIFYSV